MRIRVALQEADFDRRQGWRVNWDPASAAAENADVVANYDPLQKLKFAKVAIP